MSRKRSELIQALVSDLEPVSRPGKSAPAMLGWLCISSIYVAGVMFLMGPVRPGALDQLIQVPRFALESLIGIAVVISLAAAGFRLGIPSVHGILRRAGAPLGLALFWVGFYVYGLVDPALEPSMLGKREHCFFETFVYCLPPLLLGLYMLRRLMPLRPVWTGAVLGAGAGALPALLMQIACMYVPAHILTHHILPGALMAVIGGFLGPWVLSPGTRTPDNS